jgi:hypothetical protein
MRLQLKPELKLRLNFYNLFGLTDRIKNILGVRPS